MPEHTTGSGDPPTLLEGRVGDDNYVLNEIKRLLLGQNTVFDDQTTVERRTRIDLSSEYRLSEQNDDFSTGVSHLSNESEYRIRANNATEHLESIQRLRYNAQYPAQVGFSIRVPTLPNDNQDVKWGYWDGSDGVYWGLDATGPYIERERNGTTQGKVRESDWNGTSIDTESILQEGVVAHIDLNLYNNGAIAFQLHPRDDKGRISPVTVHREAPTEETTLSRQNLPLRVEVDNTETTDYDVFVADRAASILGQTAATERVKGEHLIDVTLSGTSWVPVFSFRKKAGFEGTPVETFGLSVLASDDSIIQLRSDMALTGASWSTPTNVDSGETAIEVDTSASLTNDINNGYQRWVDGFEGGTNNNPQFGATANIDLKLRGTRPMTLLARKVSGTGGSLPLVTARWTEDW